MYGKARERSNARARISEMRDKESTGELESDRKARACRSERQKRHAQFNERMREREKGEREKESGQRGSHEQPLPVPRLLWLPLEGLIAEVELHTLRGCVAAEGDGSDGVGGMIRHRHLI